MADLSDIGVTLEQTATSTQEISDGRPESIHLLANWASIVNDAGSEIFIGGGAEQIIKDEAVFGSIYMYPYVLWPKEYKASDGNIVTIQGKAQDTTSYTENLDKIEHEQEDTPANVCYAFEIIMKKQNGKDIWEGNGAFTMAYNQWTPERATYYPHDDNFMPLLKDQDNLGAYVNATLTKVTNGFNLSIFVKYYVKIDVNNVNLNEIQVFDYTYQNIFGIEMQDRIEEGGIAGLIKDSYLTVDNSNSSLWGIVSDVQLIMPREELWVGEEYLAQNSSSTYLSSIDLRNSFIKEYAFDPSLLEEITFDNKKTVMNINDASNMLGNVKNLYVRAINSEVRASDSKGGKLVSSLSIKKEIIPVVIYFNISWRPSLNLAGYNKDQNIKYLSLVFPGNETYNNIINGVIHGNINWEYTVKTSNSSVSDSPPYVNSVQDVMGTLTQISGAESGTAKTSALSINLVDIEAGAKQAYDLLLSLHAKNTEWVLLPPTSAEIKIKFQEILNDNLDVAVAYAFWQPNLLQVKNITSVTSGRPAEYFEALGLYTYDKTINVEIINKAISKLTSTSATSKRQEIQKLAGSRYPGNLPKTIFCKLEVLPDGEDFGEVDGVQPWNDIEGHYSTFLSEGRGGIVLELSSDDTVL